jgi:hypothetical protein
MEEINKRRESYALYKASLYERQQMSARALDKIRESNDKIANKIAFAK